MSCHNADHWVHPTPLEIATQRGHSRLAEKLQKALDNHKLLTLGRQDANTVLIRVAGPPGAGKSTLVKSLRTSRLRGFFRKESQPDEDDKNFHARTKGIKVKAYIDQKDTICRILDLGGQDDFAAANQLFIGEGQVPVIDIVTISTLKDFLKMEEEVLKWSAFFASRFDKSAHPEQESANLQPLIVVATRSETADADQVENVVKAANKAEESFGKFLYFIHGPVFVDARKSWSSGMAKLRDLLAEVTDTLLKRAPPQPTLCSDIQRALPWIQANIKRPIISRKELPELIAQGLSSRRRSFNKDVMLSHTKLLDAALRQLSDACEILSFETAELQDVLVIQPIWLLHHVVGVLLSPAKFKSQHVLYNRDGHAKRKQAEKALREASFGRLLEEGVALKMVAQLGLCILDLGEHGNVAAAEEDIIVPSKLETSRDLSAILSAGVLATIWFGIELLCSEVPLSVCLFPQVQVHLYNHLLKKCKQKPILWSGGIAVALRHEQVVGIVEARRGRVAIDIIVQGTEATRRTCFCLLQMLKEQTLLKAQAFSPGSDITEKILSSRELSSLDWSKSTNVPSIAYDKEDVEKAMEHSGKIRPQVEDEKLCILEDAFDLMAVPSTHICLMSTHGHDRFCDEMNHYSKTGRQMVLWHELALRLRMPEGTLQSIASRSTQTVFNLTGAILQWWAKRSERHTIERLLAEVKLIGHTKAEAILEKELTFSLNVLPSPADHLSPKPEGSDGSPRPPDQRNENNVNEVSTQFQIGFTPSAVATVKHSSGEYATPVVEQTCSPLTGLAIDDEVSALPAPLVEPSSPSGQTTKHSSYACVALDFEHSSPHDPVLVHSLQPVSMLGHSLQPALAVPHVLQPTHVTGQSAPSPTIENHRLSMSAGTTPHASSGQYFSREP